MNKKNHTDDRNNEWVPAIVIKNGLLRRLRVVNSVHKDTRPEPEAQVSAHYEEARQAIYATVVTLRWITFKQPSVGVAAYNPDLIEAL